MISLVTGLEIVELSNEGPSVPLMSGPVLVGLKVETPGVMRYTGT